MRTNPYLLAVLAIASVTPLSSMAAGDPVAGQKKAFTCMGCHAVASYTNAYPTYHVPKLGGQQVEYIAAALQAYQNGQRNHPTMNAQAASLSEQDMQDIAAYFAQLNP